MKETKRKKFPLFVSFLASRNIWISKKEITYVSKIYKIHYMSQFNLINYMNITHLSSKGKRAILNRIISLNIIRKIIEGLCCH